jgi:hypothetical protein
MSKKSIGCAVLGVLLWWSAVLGHDDANTPFAGPASTSVDVAYEGTLICFRCDVSPSPENRARCAQEGHAPLFKLADGHVHKLQGSTNSITAKLASDALHGKAVKIKGIYYLKTNHVFVEEVIPLGRSTGSACLLVDAAVAAVADRNKALQS